MSPILIPIDAFYRLGLSVRAYQDTMAAITALQVTMPSPRTALLVVIIILPVTYPVVLCLATWILRWRERIRARRDELGRCLTVSAAPRSMAYASNKSSADAHEST